MRSEAGKSVKHKQCPMLMEDDMGAKQILPCQQEVQITRTYELRRKTNYRLSTRE